MNKKIINALAALPTEWRLIAEAWARNCDYTDYHRWCTAFHDGVIPVDEDIFHVVCEACQEQFIFDMDEIFKNNQQ